MIQRAPPPQPPGFPPPKVKAAEQDLRAVSGAAEPVAHWQDYKPEFYRHQDQKCAWCETTNTSEWGAMDHYAPANAVFLLVNAGFEQPDSVNVRDRRYQPLHRPGYWWLAYDWNNWVYACNRCNTAWKSALFPVAESPHPGPDPQIPYTPMLLHPFGSEDPLDHLEFDDLGGVRPRHGSPRGQATIAVCGLDRPSLETARRATVEPLRTAWDAYVASERLAGSKPGLQEVEELRAKQLATLTAATANNQSFAGHKRSLLRQWSASP